MKKNLIMVALIAGAMSLTNNTAMATVVSNEIAMQARSIVPLGTITASMNAGENTVRFSCPVPDTNTILGTMPNLPYTISGGYMIVSVSSPMFDTSSGSTFSFDIGIRMSNGDTGIYTVEVSVR